jgi:putative DNA primase/helicase
MPERPIEVVTEFELEELAASYVPPKEPDLRQKHQSDFSLDRWIQEHNVPVGNPIPYRGGRKWIFESLPIPCQSSPSGHECDGSGAIFEASDGKIGAVCQHDRCRWNWKELREAYEPGCYAKYENYGSQIVEDGNLGPDEKDDRVDASRVDPETEAANVLQSHQHLGFNRLIFWGGGFLYWTKGKFVPIPNSEARTIIVKSLNERFTGVGTSVVSDVLEQVRAASLLSIQVQPPSWLTKNEWKPEDVIATENAIVHLPTLSEGSTTYTTPSTPSFFTTSALDYDFDDSKPDCANWKSFINQLWPGDQDCIDTLQEWFGYCLTPDTRQQKILMMLGPKRSGKGTICRVLRSVVGDGNVCGPTLASLQTNFGLWPLLGKTVAIVSDARLSGRSDQAVITERLLSISGEDAQTIDRKNMEPVTTKLSTRFMIVSNELPRLQDSSGAFTGRMIVLRLSESFYGREDQQLSDRLMDEREGILHWAIDGWKRLRERSHFVQPESGMELVQQLNELASPILSFVEDRCEVDDCYTITVQDLYLGWCEWCKEVGREPTTTQTFGRDLSALLPRLRLRQTRIGAHRVRTYDGIRLTESRF